jgi:tetratricopeptide (TPR) repeat protein
MVEQTPMNRQQRRAAAKQNRRLGQAGPKTEASTRIAEALNQAVAYHQSGHFSEAGALYREILAGDPDNIHTLHLLGVLTDQLGDPDAATVLIARAIAQDDRVPEFHNNLGMALQHAGRLDEAAASFERALALRPDFPAAHNNLGNTLRRLDKAEAAAAQYRAALALQPSFADAHNNLGLTLHDQGEFEKAVGHFRQAIALQQGFAEAHNNLGNTLQRLGRFDEAITCYERSLSLRPDFPEALANLGNTLQALNRLDEAIACHERTLALRPDFAEAHSNLADILHRLGRLEEALDSHRLALSLQPDMAETHAGLGLTLRELGRLDEAVASLERAAALQPEDADTLYHLGETLHKQGKLDKAVAYYAKALALWPGMASAHNNIGLALQVLDLQEEAARHFEAALAADPDNSRFKGNFAFTLQKLRRTEAALPLYEAALEGEPGLAQLHANYASALLIMGRLEQACHEFECAIELDPKRPAFHLGLADARRTRAGDPILAGMDALAAECDRLSAEDQILLHFALGKALSDIGDHDHAFYHYLQGNRLKRQQITYDEAAILGQFDRIVEVANPAFFARLTAGGNPSPVPVFILGMPRSGSTLVEQILASHPKVHGGGERLDLARTVKAFENRGGETGSFPEMLLRLDAAGLHELGTFYLDAVLPLAPDAERITDKMPSNFRFAGLIHLALPQARIIHIRRDPVDTCLSCYTQLFTGSQPFAYDLGELGRYWRGYDRLMAHWRSVLPEGAMLEVQYESLVADFEKEARRILAYCGLEWDEACLAFHRTDRPVHTASLVQVRQPIYSSSVGRARPDEEMLTPLMEGLGLVEPSAVSCQLSAIGC